MLAFFLTMLESDEERQRFVLIYEQYHKRMERVALRILEKQHDAEDAVQNAFLQVIHHFEKISTNRLVKIFSLSKERNGF